MNEFIQEEQHSDPHIHEKSTNAVPEDEEENVPEFQVQSQQIQVQQYSSSNSSPEIHNTQEEFNANLDSTKHSEITTNPKLLPQKSTPAKLFTENLDLHWEAEARGATDLTQVIMVQRPPPEPPDLKSSLEELFTMRMPTGQNVINEAEKENGANCDTKDGAIVKGKVVDISSADLTRGSSAVVGAFVEGMWTATGRTTAVTVGDRGLRDQQWRQFVLLMPPPLLASIFPWGREETTHTERAANEWLFEETHQNGDYADFRNELNKDSSTWRGEARRFGSDVIPSIFSSSSIMAGKGVMCPL
ncbi:hypothetical protein PIB30_048248 [Stylosanthes scabra]|uniref:Uncharacterized protein n=1 Tax=Stylosanthes scabra TaxID=79078 RepID=A0ABU6XFD8_9FABA|nr:hypothetical protein [Stylosanthes scabra]